MRAPLITITLSYLVGLILGRGLLYFPFTLTALILSVLILLMFLIFVKKTLLRRILIIAVPCILGAVSYVTSTTYFPEDHYTRTKAFASPKHEITGKIVSPLDRDPGRNSFIIEAGKIDTTPVSGRMRVSVRDEKTGVGYGDIVRLNGRIYQPTTFANPRGFDYPEYLAQQGVYASISVRDARSVEIVRRGKGIFRTIQDWRERIRQSFFDSTTGPGSAILQAMVLGEEGQLTDEVRDRFMAAGVTHIISISGSHLGMVAVLCFGLIRGLMLLMPERSYNRLTLIADPKKIAACLTLPLVIFYTLLAGGQVATVRSLVMIIAGLAALVLDRENALLRALALAALLILLLSPQAVFDISFQLSFVSVLVIGFIVELWNGLGLTPHTFLQKIRNSTALLIVISLSTSLATGPLVAHYFNQFSFAGIISNLIVVPFAGMVVVPLGLFSGVLSLFTQYLPLATLNQFFADAFIKTVTFFSRLPLAEFHPPSPGVLWIICYAVFILSLSSMLKARLLMSFKPLEHASRISKAPIISAALSGSLLIIALALSFFPEKGTRITFLDVGQGDCALIELSSGKNILIDGGGSYDNRFDLGRRVTAPYLWNRRINKLDLIVLSHPHPDHMNGLKFILKKFTVNELWDREQKGDIQGYADFKQIVGDNNILHTQMLAQDRSYPIAGAEIRVLHPNRDFFTRGKQAYNKENNQSLVVQIRIGNRVALFTGDIEAEAEKALTRSNRDLKCDLLKVPHHGSRSSSTEAFVSLAQPKIAIVTVGKGNPYRHPSEETLARYEQHGCRVYRTDRDGAITIIMSQDNMEVVTWKELALGRITLTASGEWAGVESHNWERLWKRRMM